MNAPLDNNRVPALLGVSKVDGSVQPVSANPTTNSLKMAAGGGTGFNRITDSRDENRKVAFFAVSAVDGVTPVEVYVDGSNNLLISYS